MSGIAGIINFDGAPAEPGVIELMTAAMDYRGPDGIRHWTNGSVALGQCMLHTTTESLEENQPLINEDQSLVLVMDGWLSNWEELREKLKSSTSILRNKSDSELVLRAYEQWGESCLEHIEGDFSLVIWDEERRLAFCARDRMGHKPFHYYWDGATLVFASDLRSIMANPQIKREVNKGLLSEFLAFEYYSCDETLWKDVFRLVAAHRLVVTKPGLRKEKYWEPDLSLACIHSTDEEYIASYREMYLDTVKRHSRSCSDVAIEVSGGLDSSAVVCVAEHLRCADTLPAPDIRAYTMTFEHGTDADEVLFAREVGDYIGVNICEVTATDVKPEWYAEEAGFIHDFPGFPNGTMSIDLRERAAEDGCRVLLTGENGDGWLCGSRVYYGEEIQSGRWRSLFELASTDAHIYGKGQLLGWLIRLALFPRLPLFLQNIARRIYRNFLGNYPLKSSDWLSPEMERRIAHRRAHARGRSMKVAGTFGQAELMEVLSDAFSAQTYERLELYGARAGLEIRHPMNSQNFVQYAFSTPARLRLRGDRAKFIHVHAMAGLMPDLVLGRKDKAEFSFALKRNVSRTKADLLVEVCSRRADWVSAEGIREMIEDSDEKLDYGLSLWVLCGLYACDKVFQLD